MRVFTYQNIIYLGLLLCYRTTDTHWWAWYLKAYIKSSHHSNAWPFVKQILRIIYISMSNLIFLIQKLIHIYLHPTYYIVLQPSFLHYTNFQKIFLVWPDKLYSAWSCARDNQRADDGDGQGGGSKVTSRLSPHQVQNFLQ